MPEYHVTYNTLTEHTLGHDLNYAGFCNAILSILFTCFTRPSGLSTRSLPLFTFKVTVERRGSIANNLNSNLRYKLSPDKLTLRFATNMDFDLERISILPLSSDWSVPNMIIIDNVPNLHSSSSHNLLTLYGSYKNSNSWLPYKMRQRGK